MAFIFFILALPFIIIGVLLALGKANGLLEKSQEHQSRFNEEEVLKFVGKTSIGIGFSIILFGFGELIHSSFTILAIIFIVAHVFFGTVYLLTDPRFQK